MTGISSPIPPGLGPPVQILPQQHQAPRRLSSASTYCSTILSYQIRPSRRVYQHSSDSIRHQRQRVLLLDNHVQSRRVCVNYVPSFYHGDVRALKQRRPWSKKYSKDAFNSHPTGELKKPVDVPSFNRPLDGCQRPPQNDPSLVTQIPTAPDSQFPPASLDQSKSRDLDRAPGNFDRSTSSSTVEVVRGGSKSSSKPVPTVSTITEHRRLVRATKSKSDQRAPSLNNGRPPPRFEARNVPPKPRLPRSTTNSNPNSSEQSEVRVESKNTGTGTRNWARDSAQGNARTHAQSARTTTEAITGLRNRLQRGIAADSFTYVQILQMCLQQNDLFAAKQVHECIIESGMGQNPYVAGTLLNVYIKCRGLVDARQVFDAIEKKTVIHWNSLIAGYAKNGNAESAFELFKSMRQDGVRPNNVTYLCILKACASPSALKWGKEVHACIPHGDFESDVRVGSALLQMYVKCGCITEAKQVFENLTNRNIAAWNIMIRAHAESGRGMEAYELFLQMRREGFEPDAYTYTSILNASAPAGTLEWVRKIQGHAVKAGLESDLRVGSALVHMYAKSGSFDDARLVFDRMEKRDAITWTIMIGAYAESGRGVEAYGLFLQMRREGFEPDAFTYASILNSSASTGALEWVKKVHGHARQSGLESDLLVGNALVHMYAKSDSFDDARLVFDRMEKRDAITWTTMIGAYADSGRGMEAYGLFLQMRQEGFQPDASTYASILNASASAGALEWVKKVHGHARQSGLELDLRVGSALVHMYAKSGSIEDARLVFDRMEKRDAITWTIMIAAYAENGEGMEAYGLFLQMRREGFEPDASTYASILNASASTGALEWVRKVHGHARQSGLELDLRVGSALVHMYAKSGSIEDARLVFDRMEKRDAITWTIMIGGLAQHGCGHEALELFGKMNVDRVKPNELSFVAVLSACSHGGLVDEGRRIFSAMTEDYGIQRTIVHYSCMVDLLGRAGHLEGAKQFISDMPVEPDAVIWRALLGACRTYHNVEMGELAAQEVLKLEPDDASAYVLLSNIYAAAGKWDKVSSVRSMMQERNVRKEPGRSWIEVDNKIHEFVVGDTSHPEAEAIYTELNKLTEKLKAEGYIPDTRLVLHDINEDDKELSLCSHSEKLAIVYGLMHLPSGEPIRISKNLRVCSDCHSATKYISKVTGREIIARDANRFHHFKDGMCSCDDYW